VKKFLPGTQLYEDGTASKEFELIVRLTTRREEWRVGWRTKVAIDQTAEGLFGELEIEVAMPEKSEGEVNEDSVKRLEMERDRFMRKFGWAFPGKDEVIVGKLAAAIIASRGRDQKDRKEKMIAQV